MPTLEDVLNAARQKLERGDRPEAARLIIMAAKAIAGKNLNTRAAQLYEEAADIYHSIQMIEECVDALDKATLMLIRAGSESQIQQEIARISEKAGRVTEENRDFSRAVEYYTRASDFATTTNDKTRLSTLAADALEKLADAQEMDGDFNSAIALLKKSSMLYFAVGDDELGQRLNERALRVANKWAEEAKKRGDLFAAGNALAEAAQIKQATGDIVGTTRLMQLAGELYEKAGFYEKAGNIYDAANDLLRGQRLTSASRTAAAKAAEAYMKMDGKPEVVAPLLVKAANIFAELGLGVKSKWAFKRAAELFGELAKKALAERDIDSQQKYLRFQAMCLKRWGDHEQADAIYFDVISYYLSQTQNVSAADNMETIALAFDEAATVLYEAGRKEQADKHMEQVIDIYVELADKSNVSEQPDESSKYYTKAAEVATRLSDTSRSYLFHRLASVKAERAARMYMRMDITELATTWWRTAGVEALATRTSKMARRAIRCLRRSARDFREINELKEAFEDLYTIFTVVMLYYPYRTEYLLEILTEMDEIALTTRDTTMKRLIAVLRPIQKHAYIAALLALQEHERELLDKRETLKQIIEKIKW